MTPTTIDHGAAATKRPIRSSSESSSSCVCRRASREEAEKLRMANALLPHLARLLEGGDGGGDGSGGGGEGGGSTASPGPTPAPTEEDGNNKPAPSSSGPSPALGFGWFVFALVVAAALLASWCFCRRFRRRREQRALDSRSRQADQVLGDMQMVPNADLDNELL
jgi:hypothetical protein